MHPGESVMNTDLIRSLGSPAHPAEAVDCLLPGKMSLSLGQTFATEPRSGLVTNKLVIDVWLVAKLVPAEITSIAEHNLVFERAQASGAHFAESLLCSPLSPVLALGRNLLRARDLRGLHGIRIISSRFQDLTTRLCCGCWWWRRR